MLSLLNLLGQTQPWSATTSSFESTESLSPLDATDTTIPATHLNRWKWSAFRGRNFFEKNVGEYSKSGVGVDKVDQAFALDASFWFDPLLPHSYFNLFMSTCCTPSFVLSCNTSLLPTTPHLLFLWCYRNNMHKEWWNVYWSQISILEGGLILLPTKHNMSQW